MNATTGWTAPEDTALRTMVGWNIETMFMLTIAGIVFCYKAPEDRALGFFVTINLVLGMKSERGKGRAGRAGAYSV